MLLAAHHFITHNSWSSTRTPACKRMRVFINLHLATGSTAVYESTNDGGGKIGDWDTWKVVSQPGDPGDMQHGLTWGTWAQYVGDLGATCGATMHGMLTLVL